MSKSQIQIRRGISGTLGSFWYPGSKPKNQKMWLGMTKNVDIIGFPEIFFVQILWNVSKCPYKILKNGKRNFRIRRSISGTLGSFWYPLPKRYPKP
jgi:hypothetical protein